MAWRPAAASGRALSGRGQADTRYRGVDDSAPPSRTRTRLSDFLDAGVGVRSISLTVLALLAVLYTLYFAQAVLLPLVLAVLVSLLLSPLVRVLQQKLRIPRGLGAAIVLGALVGLVAIGASFVVEPATAWMQTIPSRVPELKARLNAFRKPLEKLRDTSEQVAQLTDVGRPRDQAVVSVREATPATVLMHQTPAFLANVCVAGILLYFLLAAGDTFLRKLVRLIPRFEDKRRAVEIAHEIEERISRYLLAITLVNAGLGVAVGIAAWAVGLKNFVLWGVLAFVLNYVPYIGAFVCIVATFVVGLLSFESTLHAFFMPALYFLFNAIEANFVTPLVVGRFLTLNPVMVFLSLLFWGWIWGIPGALLAVPILAIFKIVCDHVEPLAPIGELVGDEPGETG
jgi:predicted PurR-regulated permease PerM